MPSQNTPENTTLSPRHSCLVGVLFALLAAAGCATQDPVDPRNARASEHAPVLLPDDPAGSSAELVFSSIDVQRGMALSASDPANQLARTNSLRRSVESRSLASRVAYPDPQASSLDRLRTLYLLPRPERVQYFERERPRNR